ncbi:hypothetical protein DACRYDRAFT_115291 [Dacryopinax primogenitus]|uniref:Aminoglycoside phosphotransferase domain-containing protein n=1 Tax=Dacryopinax primogenitus (strain DJM 731) TaxID=1858805 RepID=M5GAL9_DACPD|nr:uncharacterized protein DACRYDRAFT_115291 [Dacryopinax primogenitus]EJU03007.1 hypothetical protein DACRYDRAFT_115291 [Dacryopinax primogenitus]
MFDLLGFGFPRWLWIGRVNSTIEPHEHNDDHHNAVNAEEVERLVKERFFHGRIGPVRIHPTVFRVSENIVIKRVQRTLESSYEVWTMQYVSSHTTILIPRVHNWSYSSDECLNIVMDYIDGEDLRTLWPKLSLWRKIWIIWTIRDYIKQLRALRLPGADVVGPVDGTGKPIRCYGEQFAYSNPPGPFDSYDKFVEFFDHARAVTIHRNQNWKPCGPPKDERLFPHFDRSGSLVFTHGDVGMQNIRIDKEGKVWLLDWGMSGMYPPWWEYTSFRKYDNRAQFFPWLWARGVPFMAGWYPAAERYINSIRDGMDNPYWIIE